MRYVKRYSFVECLFFCTKLFYKNIKKVLTNEINCVIMCSETKRTFIQYKKPGGEGKEKETLKR